MPADRTAAHSGDRSRRCLTLAGSARPNGKRDRVVRLSRRRSTDPSPIRATSHRARRRPPDRTRNLAPFISLLRAIAEGGGS